MGQLKESEADSCTMSADLASHDQAASADDRDFDPSYPDDQSLPDILQDLKPRSEVVELRLPVQTRTVSCQVEQRSRRSPHAPRNPGRRKRSKENKGTGLLKQELSAEDREKTRKMKNLASHINVPKMQNPGTMNTVMEQNMWTKTRGGVTPSEAIIWDGGHMTPETNNNIPSQGTILNGGVLTSASLCTSDKTNSNQIKQLIGGECQLTPALRATFSPVVFTQTSSLLQSSHVRGAVQTVTPQDDHRVEDNALVDDPSEYPEIIGNYTQVVDYDDKLDDLCQQRALSLLRASGSYYGQMAMQTARQKLKHSAPGTYLLRDSSDSRYFLALSVKTQRGTTAIRISFTRGRFRLDCEQDTLLKMPSFDCIMKLIQYYNVATTKTKGQKCVFLESNGRKDTPVVLRRPYLEKAPSLKHMCRVALNRVLSEEQRRRLLIFMSPDIEEYLLEYPFFV